MNLKTIGLVPVIALAPAALDPSSNDYCADERGGAMDADHFTSPLEDRRLGGC